MKDTIGLSTLLAEIDADLDELRRKHPTDFGVKTTSMWWELERERLVLRHGSGAVKTPRVGRLRRLLRRLL